MIVPLELESLNSLSNNAQPDCTSRLLDSIELQKREKYEISDEKGETKVFGVSARALKMKAKDEKYKT